MSDEKKTEEPRVRERISRIEEWIRLRERKE